MSSATIRGPGASLGFLSTHLAAQPSIYEAPRVARRPAFNPSRGFVASPLRGSFDSSFSYRAAP